MSRLTKILAVMIVGWGSVATAQVVISGQVNYQGTSVPYAPIQVCAVTSTGTPCTPVSNLYSDYNLANRISNPTSADQDGNYTFYAGTLSPPGFYVVQTTPVQGTTWSYVVNASTGSLGNYLPITGGTLTGPLNGTSASFPGTVAAGAVIPAEPTNTQGLWTRYGTVISGTSASGYAAQEPMVLPDGAGGVDMWLTCGWGVGGVCYSHSTDGLTFSAWTVLPTLAGYEHGYVVLVGSTYYYYGDNFAGGSHSFSRFHSTDKLTWVLDATGILPVNGTGWEQQYVGNIDVWTSATAPCVVGGTSNTWCALHEAQDAAGLWSIGLAYSSDGLAWTEYSGLATPTGTPTGTPSGSGGTVGAGANYAKIVAVDAAGKTTAAGAESAVVTTTTSASTIAWEWTAVPNASSYQVYVGSASGVETNFFTSSTNSYMQTQAINQGVFAQPPTTASTGNPIISVAGGSAGGPEMHYISATGRYALWFHSATIGGVPTDITYGYSTDLVGWNLGGAVYGGAAGLSRATVDEGLFTTQGQTADPSLIDLNGQAHLYYSATDTQTPTSTDGIHIKVAISPLSIAQLSATQTNGATWEGWKGNVTGSGNYILQNAPTINGANEYGPAIFNPAIHGTLNVSQPVSQNGIVLSAPSTSDTIYSQQGGPGGNTQLFSIRTNGNLGVDINTQNGAYMAFGVSPTAAVGSTVEKVYVYPWGMGIGRPTQVNGSILNVNGHISADAFYGSDGPLTTDLTCSSGGYWLAPIAGSTNNWRMCSNGTLSTLGSGGSYLPLSGGTLTGALSGTSASFSGTLAAGTALQVPNTAQASSSNTPNILVNSPWVREGAALVPSGTTCEGTGAVSEPSSWWGPGSTLLSVPSTQSVWHMWYSGSGGLCYAENQSVNPAGSTNWTKQSSVAIAGCDHAFVYPYLNSGTYTYYAMCHMASPTTAMNLYSAPSAGGTYTLVTANAFTTSSATYLGYQMGNSGFLWYPPLSEWVWLIEGMSIDNGIWTTGVWTSTNVGGPYTYEGASTSANPQLGVPGQTAISGIGGSVGAYLTGGPDPVLNGSEIVVYAHCSGGSAVQPTYGCRYLSPNGITWTQNPAAPGNILPQLTWQEGAGNSGGQVADLEYAAGADASYLFYSAVPCQSGGGCGAGSTQIYVARSPLTIAQLAVTDEGAGYGAGVPMLLLSDTQNVQYAVPVVDSTGIYRNLSLSGSGLTPTLRTAQIPTTENPTFQGGITVVSGVPPYAQSAGITLNDASGSHSYEFAMESSGTELAKFAGGNGYGTPFFIQNMQASGTPYILKTDSTGDVWLGAETASNKFEINSTGKPVAFGDATLAASQQLTIAGNTNSSQQLNFGYDTTNNFGWLQATLSGTANEPLLLNPNGADVLVNTQTDCGSSLCVDGHISADAFYGSDGPLTTDLTCSSGGYWLAPIAGSTNNWRMCSNGTLSTLGSGGGGSYLPLSGGTLTGPLNGTSASFSGAVAAGGAISGASGSFSGQVSGATGAFSSAVTTPSIRSTTVVPTAAIHLGDSITACNWVPISQCYPYMVDAALGIATSNINNYAVGGQYVAYVMPSEALPHDTPSQLAPQPLRTVMVGTNDANNLGAGFAAYVPTFTMLSAAIFSFEAIPIQAKVAGGAVITAGNYSGSCSNLVTYPTITGINCTSLGATATFLITTFGGPVYMWPITTVGDVGAWTFSVDGGAAISEVTDQGIQGATTSVGYFRVAGLAAGSHTITFNKTSAGGNMGILAVGTVPPSKIPSQPYIIAGEIPNHLNNGDQANVDMANAAIDGVVATLSGDGLNVFLAPVNSYVQMSSAALDFAQQEYIGGYTAGSGYSGTGTCSFVGGTYTVLATCTAVVSGGGIIPTIGNNGAYTVAATGISYSGFTGGSGASAYPQHAGMLHPGPTGNNELQAAMMVPMKAVQQANSLNPTLTQSIVSSSYTLQASDGIIYMECSTACTMSLPNLPGNGGPFIIYNFGPANLTMAGALDNIPSTLLPGQSILIQHFFSSWFASASFGIAPPSLSLSAVVLTSNHTMSPTDGVLFFSGSGITLTLPTFTAPAGPFFVINYGSSPMTIAGALNNIPSTLLPGQSVIIQNFFSSWFASASFGASSALTGTTGSIGGSALAAGACASGTVAISGVTSYTQVATASPLTYGAPGAAFVWKAYPSSVGYATVDVCAIIAGTPTATTYTVKVSQ